MIDIKIQSFQIESMKLLLTVELGEKVLFEVILSFTKKFLFLKKRTFVVLNIMAFNLYLSC